MNRSTPSTNRSRESSSAMRGRDVHISAANFVFYCKLTQEIKKYYLTWKHDCLVKKEIWLKQLVALLVNNVTFPAPLHVPIVCHCKVLRSHSCEWQERWSPWIKVFNYVMRIAVATRVVSGSVEFHWYSVAMVLFLHPTSPSSWWHNLNTLIMKPGDP